MRVLDNNSGCVIATACNVQKMGKRCHQVDRSLATNGFDREHPGLHYRYL